MPKAAPGLRYRCRVISPPSSITDRWAVRLPTASAFEAASMAHTATAIKKAATVYRQDLITRAATPACYGRRCRPGGSRSAGREVIPGLQGSRPPGREPRSRRAEAARRLDILAVWREVAPTSGPFWARIEGAGCQ